MNQTDTIDYSDWKVDVPPYDSHGVLIERFEITQDMVDFSELRALFNPQRPNRSPQAGIYTRMIVDETFWMSDTPAEIQDHLEVDDAMAFASDSHNETSALIVGLGLGLVLNRAIQAHEFSRIDVVEREQRVIDAVGPYYRSLAHENQCFLDIHCADIHAWKIPQGMEWDIGWFDIWATIDCDDMPEVTRLRKRFGKRLGWFGAWAQDERIGQKRRIRTGKGFY